MNDSPQAARIYPNISDILERKAQGRRERAALSFSEKIARIETMRAELAPFNRAREARRKAAAPPRSEG